MADVILPFRLLKARSIPGSAVSSQTMDISSVFLDYYDGNDSILVARVLDEFFDRSIQNAGSLVLLTQTS